MGKITAPTLDKVVIPVIEPVDMARLITDAEKAGKILVRITGKVTPTVAKQFEDATAKL